MLAIVFGCERYHTLLYGKRFTVVTDHKPLVTICQKTIHSAPARLQRMLLRVQGYDFQVIYRPGAQMILADALSRLPNAANNAEIDLDTRVDDVTIDMTSADLRDIAMINFASKRRDDIITETSRDPELNALKELIFHGWPENVKDVPTQLHQYWSYREELAIEGGVLFKGKQVIIPQSLRAETLKKLHQAHLGIEKTRRLTRESCYWPNINKDVEKTCRECPLCQEYQRSNRAEPLIAYDTPSRKWQYIASDLFQIGDRHFLMIADKYSKYPLVDEVPNPVNSAAVTSIIKRYCGIFGKPQIIYSDNGPQYAGEAFKKFVNEWAIQHVTSSPTYAQSNGFVERQIGYIKPLLEKAIKSKQDIDITLLNIRATPIDSKLASPAELLLGAPIATLLPSRLEVGKEGDRDQLQQRSARMISEDGEKSTLPPLIPGQFVRIQSHRNNKWFPGVVIKPHSSPRSYLLRSNGRVIRRNRVHIREAAKDEQTKCEQSPRAVIEAPKPPPV